MNPLVLLAISIGCAASAQLLIKKGVTLLGQLEFSLVNAFNVIFQVIKNLYIMSGLFLLGVSFLLWIFVISKKQLSVIYPISASLSICLVALFSLFLFKEQLSNYQIIGIGLAVSGVFLLLK